MRESGNEESIEPFEVVTTTMPFRDEEVPTSALEDLLQRLDAAAEDMAGQIARRMYDQVSKLRKWLAALWTQNRES